jgi:hypothetical protein
MLEIEASKTVRQKALERGWRATANMLLARFILKPSKASGLSSSVASSVLSIK